jgi:putative peptidoglycan lipid II flippase
MERKPAGIPKGRLSRTHSRAQLAGARAVNQSFVSSAALIAGLSAITGVALLGRESLTASYFGRSDPIEAYLVAALIPLFLINATGNSIGAGFVPTLLRVRHDRDQQTASDLTAAMLLLTLGLVAVAMLAAAVLFPFVLPLIARGFAPPKLELAMHIFYWLLPIVVIGALGKFWLAILNGYEYFVAGSLIPIVVPLTVIGFLLYAPIASRLDFLIYGVIAGFGLQLALALIVTGRAELLRLPRLSHRVKPLLAAAASQYFAMLAGTLTLMLLEVVDTVFAAMQGAGTVAAINYASKLSLLILGFAGTALATAVVPHYARLRAAGTLAEQARFVRFAEWITLAGAALLALILVFSSTQLVQIIFGRGHFGEQDVTVVAKLNALYVLQAPAFLAGVVYGRLLLVEGHSRDLLIGAVLSVASAVAANLILGPLIHDVAIPIAAVIAYVTSAVWLRFRLAAVLHARHDTDRSDG